MWAYFTMPLTPVWDASSDAERINGATPMMEALKSLSEMTNTSVKRRAAAKSNYREFHALLVDVPVFYQPDPDNAIAPHLKREYGRMEVQKRVCVFGVRLIDSMTSGDGGIKDQLSSAFSTVSSVIIDGTLPLSAFDADYKKVSGAMARAGLSQATNQELDFVDSWWDRYHRSDAPTLEHPDHIHVFANSEEARRAASDFDSDCTHPEWDTLDESQITFLSVADIGLADSVDSISTTAMWVCGLMQGGNASAVSFRGKIEPSVVTRQELRRKARAVRSDINDAAAANKAQRAEQDEILGSLESYEAHFSDRNSEPVIMDMSIVVAASGKVNDPSGYSQSVGVECLTMSYKQMPALTESWIASPLRANPKLHDMPIQTLSYSGIANISRVGDRTGALLGMTENDRQPAYVMPSAASKLDSEPLFVVPGTTGSGKLLTLDTPVITPNGKVPIGELKLGDEVFTRRGTVTTVSYLSPIDETPDLHRIELSDNQKIKADKNHQWVVVDLESKTGGAAILRSTHEARTAALTKLAESAPTNAFGFDISMDWFRENYPKFDELPWSTADEFEHILDFMEVDEISPKSLVTAVAARLVDRFSGTVSLGYNEQRMTTKEMVLAGLIGRDGKSRFAIAPASALRVDEVGFSTSMLEAGLLTRQGNTELVKEIAAKLGSPDQRKDFLNGCFGFVDRTPLSFPAETANLLIDIIRSVGWIAKTRQDDRGIEIEIDSEVFLNIRSATPIESEPGMCISVADADSTYLCAGYVPTSNTMVLLSLAVQFSMAGHATIIVDPKQDSDHSAIVLSTPNAKVISLDSIMRDPESDGIFDPIRFSKEPEFGLELAHSMLMYINPWGRNRENVDAEIADALSYGVYERGAVCTGQALQLAVEDGKLSKATWEPVTQLFRQPTFAACCGRNPNIKGLSVAEGITLIKVGNRSLALPLGKADSEMSTGERSTLTMIRNMVYGSAVALSGRANTGVVMLDEAWVFLGAGASEVEKLGRLARSQNVLPMLFTQKITDAVKAGVGAYISRGIILPVKDRDEAVACCELFGLEPSMERLNRITAKAFTGASDEEGNGAPNWRSMRHLQDPVTGKHLRGTIGIYCDLFDRSVPVEIMLSDHFLNLASTNPEDQERRKQERLAIEAGGREAALAIAPESEVHVPVVQEIESEPADLDVPQALDDPFDGLLG
jgi:hypothetical protein